MKKIKLLIILILIFAITSCRAYPNYTPNETTYLLDDGTKVLKKEILFKNYSTVYPNKGNEKRYLDTYFFDGSVIPYVSIGDYISMVDFFDNDKIVKKGYTYTYSPNNYPKKIEVNPEDDTLTMYDYEFYSIDEAEYNSGRSYYSNLDMKFEETTYGNKKIIDLSDYYLRIKEAFNKALIPFHVVNAIFAMNSYYYTFYLGNEYRGTSYEDGNVSCYDYTNGITLTDEYLAYNYDFISFTFNELYGLKDYYGYDINKMLRDKMFSKRLNKNEYLTGFHEFIESLEDCHTGLWYSSDFFTISSYADNSNRYKEIKKVYSDVSDAKYEAAQNNPIFSEQSDDLAYLNDEIAYIRFDEFNIEGRFSPLRLNEYLLKCKKKGIKDVIFDVSLNGGGDTFALTYILGMMTNDDIIIRNRNVITKHIYDEVVKVDVNGDGDFNDNDAYDNFNYYILSSGFSYSCANEFISYCKDNNLATILGQKSGGGACSIYPLVTPTGALLQVSSLDAFYDKNGNLVEDGVDVDYILPYDKFYDSTYMINLINNINN